MNRFPIRITLLVSMLLLLVVLGSATVLATPTTIIGAIRLARKRGREGDIRPLYDFAPA